MKEPIYIVGPTASGKSAVALELASLVGGEIVSVDSIQVYRGLDIGSAKPTLAQRRQTPHHLLDVVDVSEPFDAAQFVDLAGKAVRAIQERGRRPIFCGGTGLYLHAYLHGLGSAPPSDPAVRAQLAQRPPEDLLAELRRRDPETYQWIDRNNPRRVERALEVVLITGKPFGSARADWKSTRGEAPKFLGLRWDRDALWRRIEARAEQMVAEGLFEETRRALDAGLMDNPSAARAIGYRQAVDYLEGVRDREATIAEIALRTRQFAKRQMTWFRGKASVEWWQPSSEDELMALASRWASIDPMAG